MASSRWHIPFMSGGARSSSSGAQRSGFSNVEAAPPTENSVPAFFTGMQVRIRGLQNAGQLNGKVGVCEELLPGNGRWRVRLWSGSVKDVRPENLEPVPALERVYFCAEPVECILRWRAGGADPSPCSKLRAGSAAGSLVALDLRAYLAGPDGKLLGRVDGSGRLDQEQFRKIGAQHLGSADVAPGSRTETVELHLPVLDSSGLCSYVFLWVAPRPGPGSISGASVASPEAYLQVCRRGGVELFSVDLGSDVCGGREGGLGAGYFVRGQNGGGWVSGPTKLPLGTMSMQGDWEQCIVNEMALQAQERADSFSRLPGEAAPAAPSDSKPGRAQEGSTPQQEEEEDLRTLVRSCEDVENWQCALEAQEALVQLLLKEERQPLLDHALRKQEELLERIARPTSTEDAEPELCCEPRPAEAEDPAVRTPAHSGGYPAEAAVPEIPRAPPPTLGATEVEEPSEPPTIASSLGCPIEPSSGSVRGGVHLQWLEAAGGPPPLDLYINGRPCAALHGGVFVAPMCRAQTGSDRGTLACDVQAVTLDGEEVTYRSAFTYWSPGELLYVSPASGPLTGGREITVATSDLGALISEVWLADRPCELLGPTSSTKAVVTLPPGGPCVGPAPVLVKASNGNQAADEEGRCLFRYFVPDAFGLRGAHVELSDEGRTAQRVEGVTDGLVLGAFPARRVQGGLYFEVLVGDVVKNASRTIAVGFAPRQNDNALCQKGSGRLRATEARELERAWLAGYERGGALFLCDGLESKIPTSAWRPVTHVKAGTRIGVLLASAAEEPLPPRPEDSEFARRELALVIFQDGDERVRLPIKGPRAPSADEDLFAVVDIQGSVRQVTLVEDASPWPASDDV